MPQLAIHPCRQLYVRQHVGSGETEQRRAHGRRTVPVLALRDIELGVPDPVADGAFVAQGDSRDMVPGIGFGDATPGPPDNNRNLALIVQLLRFRWPHEVVAMANEARREPDEERGIQLRCLSVLVLGIAVWEIDPDADDLAGGAKRRQQLHLIKSECRLTFRHEQLVKRAGIRSGAEIREPAGEIGAQIGHALPFKAAKAMASLIYETDETGHI